MLTINLYTTLNALFLLTFQPRQQFELIHDGLHALLCHDSRLTHFLHRKVFIFILFAFDAPHFPEATPANWVVKDKVILCYLYIS